MNGRYWLAACLIAATAAGCQPGMYTRSQFASERPGRAGRAISDKSKPFITDDRFAEAAAPAALPAGSPVEPAETPADSGAQRAFHETKWGPRSRQPEELPQPQPARTNGTGEAKPAAKSDAPAKPESAPNGPLLLPDPHVRSTPTAGGALLNLGPGESPLDRVLDLTRKLDACCSDNAVLQGKVKALEGAAEGREQTVAEAVREVEGASGEVARARADLQTLRKEIAALRERMREAEQEDVEFLRTIIAALERLLEPPPMGVKP